ncbi:helix-turn-helix transcriptional regulator [Kribbella sp. NPDC026611]|uniref:helix-turn-helix transcriptional regulator n=1 Tax=Kribbella sp. NPDC026611 TaxID=3154911 RepID=UPI0033EB51A6
MPRREREIDPSVGPVAEFAYRLRQARRRSGLTYRELADRTPYSHAHLVRAAKGDQLPSWLVARAYLAACGVTGPQNLKLWEQLWIAAAKTEASNLNRRIGGSLRHITTAAGFGEHLRDFSNRHQRHTLRELQTKTGIGKSTLGEWFTGARLPSVARLYHFAGVLGATQREQTELRQVRDRLAREAGDRSTAGALLASLRDLEDTTADALETWQISRALVDASEQRIENDSALSTWNTEERPTFAQRPAGRHRADTGVELSRARDRIEELARALGNPDGGELEGPATVGAAVRGSEAPSALDVAMRKRELAVRSTRASKDGPEALGAAARKLTLTYDMARKLKVSNARIIFLPKLSVETASKVD